jgi:hypothetical protein
VDNTSARIEIRRRGLDCVTPWFAKVLHKTRIIKGVNVGDLKKSWDVLRTLQFIEQHVGLGACASEILLSLIAEVDDYGLVPVGELNFEVSEATVRCLNRDYTFAWFAFQKVDVHTQPAHEGRVP